MQLELNAKPGVNISVQTQQNLDKNNLDSNIYESTTPEKQQDK